MKKMTLIITVLILLATGKTFCRDWPENRYQLKRGNLHIHSGKSSKIEHLNFLSKIGALPYPREYLDHRLAGTCKDICEIAKKSNLDFIGITDHDAVLTSSDWQELLNLAEKENSESFALLPGFEWTYSDYQHINIFGSSSFISAVIEFDGYGLIGADKKVAIAPDLESIYKWMAATGAKDKYLVCQWNHPSYSKNLYNQFRIPSDVSNYMALIEIRSGFLFIHTDITEEERNFQKSIQAGCYTAPTIGNDSYGNPFSYELKKFHTAVWTYQTTLQNPRERILLGLRERKAYASEDDNFILKYWGTVEGSDKTYYLGDRAKLKHGQTVTLEVNLSDQDESIGDVRLVTVKKNTTMEGDFNPNRYYIKDKFCYLTRECKPDRDVMAYYVKIIQDDGDIVISAPIFINWQGIEEKKYLKVISSIPRNGAFDINPYHPSISINFDKPLAKTQEANDKIVNINPLPDYIEQAHGGRPKIIIDSDYGEIHLENYNFFPQKNYVITINDVIAKDGCTLDKPFKLSFTTGHNQSMKKLIGDIEGFVKDAKECSKFSARIITAEKVVWENNKYQPINEGKTFSIGQNITIFIEIANLRSKYNLPCTYSIIIFNPYGNLTSFSGRITSTGALESKTHIYKLDSRGKHRVILYLNGRQESSHHFTVK